MAINVGYVARETGQNLRRNPTLTIASVVTVAVALTLAGVALLVREGVDNLSGRFRDDVDIIIFVKVDATQAQIDALDQALADNAEVKSHRYVDSDAAFAEAQELFAENETMREVLRKEDLPTSFRVKPTNPDIEAVTALKSVFEAEPGVKEVLSASEAIKAIQELSRNLNLGVFLGAAVSAGIAVLLIYNTIRTAMFARRREIEVMKLVGATNWFIRVPFILEGVVQALLGGLLTIGLLLGLNRVLFQSLAKEDFLDLFQEFDFATSTVIATSVPLILVGVIIGAVGSGFAVGRFLDV